MREGQEISPLVPHELHGKSCSPHKTFRHQKKSFTEHNASYKPGRGRDSTGITDETKTEELPVLRSKVRKREREKGRKREQVLNKNR